MASYLHLFNQTLTDADRFFKQIASNFNTIKMIGDNVDIKALNERIEKESAFIDLLTQEMNKVIIGQKKMVERLLIALLGQGHILLEGVPGLAKTLAINTLSKSVKGTFSRIQFTPDLLPADVI